MKPSYHFIGIGGIGMSALAKLLIEKKIKVKGSDIKSNAIINELKKNGAHIQIGHKKEFISSNDTIVISSAIDKKNEEYLQAKKLNLKIFHRSDLLDQLMHGHKSILITGTHGKTTTSALLCEVLLKSQKQPSFAIGGILNSKKTNAQIGKGKYFIAEADESDGSFINFKNKAAFAIVTNLEEDHLNYWKNFTNLKKAFKKFLSNIEKQENLFWCIEDKNLTNLKPKGTSYGFSKKADIYAHNIRLLDFQTIFDLKIFDKVFKDIKINLIGNHNVLNAASVFALSLKLKINEKTIKNAFENFSGISRRLEKIGEKNKITFFDDYAHHPTEIKSTLTSLREAVKEKRIIGIFQPHRYSRLKDCLDEFVASFDVLDELIITDIYSASEKPIKNINEKVLVDLIKKRDIKAYHIPDDQLESYLLDNLLYPFDVVIALGAGDISSKIRKIFSKFTLRKSQKINLGIIYGGESNEHDISIKSTKNYIQGYDKDLYNLKCFKILKNGSWQITKEIEDSKDNEKLEDLKIDESYLNKKTLKEKIPIDVFKELTTLDVALPILHGPLGEDGMIDAFLRVLGIASAGCDYFSAPIAMDKAFAKHLVKNLGILTLDFLEVYSNDWLQKQEEYLSKIIKNFKFPLYVKPNHLGSSIGIKVVETKKDLKDAIDYVFKFDTSLIIEKKIIAREIQTAVIGNDFFQFGKVAEMLTYGEFFDFENKYQKATVKARYPKDFSRKKLHELEMSAKKIYQALKLSGFARIDFFITKNQKIYFFEINPIPGYSSNNSTFAKMLDLIGFDNKKMIDYFITLALHRQRKNQKFLKGEKCKKN
ncbi:MAG: UDP-N-acetylmuramate--L-alanine ligase [Candidatus Anoxychlamydiales bacterium]|nr:UDP-N-acetylmuramate--L-alanine ligase [Candidatus Anoxychlamydiales bacterium]NGX35821.1 UDP-N-acetylmuramate--L-alanine ligase [Candidatus Anoxychlamydiales bacterium]